MFGIAAAALCLSNGSIHSTSAYALLHARRWHMRIRAHHVFLTICDRCEYFMWDKRQQQRQLELGRGRQSDIFARIIYGLSLACCYIMRSTCEAQEQRADELSWKVLEYMPSSHHNRVSFSLSPSLAPVVPWSKRKAPNSSLFSRVLFYFFPCQISCPTNLRHCRVRPVAIVTTLETRQYE